ncbi:MAG: hypothetical protein OEV42_05620 [Deltaproteobacteria bacterium]|nr:hypothetical protein [Deltaproteobacteria bacterium]
MAAHSDNNEVSLGKLISRIKSEGIEEASKKAEDIITGAKADAARIVDEAERKALHIVTNARKEAEESSQRGIDSLKLAARDSAIALKRSIEETFRSVILKDCNEALTGEALQSLIGKIAEAWHKGDKERETLEIIISEKDRKGLSDSFIKKLGKALERGVEVKGRSGMKGGFRAGLKGGHMYYDFSDEAVAELLLNNLFPELAAILDERGKKEEDK